MKISVHEQLKISLCFVFDNSFSLLSLMWRDIVMNKNRYLVNRNRANDVGIMHRVHSFVACSLVAGFVLLAFDPCARVLYF